MKLDHFSEELDDFLEEIDDFLEEIEGNATKIVVKRPESEMKSSFTLIQRMNRFAGNLLF